MIGGDEMKIVVLNGSPKGDLSVTMQYIHYMKKKFPQHEWVIHNISQRINAIEKKEERFRTIIDEIRSAEGVFWVFPVYFLLVPYNYKRFIELIWERGAEDAFKGIYAASLSTSIHYFDHIAHKYIHGICDDLNMKYVDGFSADMYDLLNEKERKRLLLFAKHFFGAIDSQLPRPRNFRPVVQDSFEYVPGAIPKKIDIDHQKLVVLTDEKSEKTNLGRMIQQFTSIVSDEAELINLHEIDIHGGCLGCIQCGYDNSCAYGHTEFNCRLSLSGSSNFRRMAMLNPSVFLAWAVEKFSETIFLVGFDSLFVRIITSLSEMVCTTIRRKTAN
jgi:multimeric flavodoxin WrbA